MNVGSEPWGGVGADGEDDDGGVGILSADGGGEGEVLFG